MSCILLNGFILSVLLAKDPYSAALRTGYADMISQLYRDPQLEYGRAIQRRSEHGAYNWCKNVWYHRRGFFWAAVVFTLAMECHLLLFFRDERQNCTSF